MSDDPNVFKTASWEREARYLLVSTMRMPDVAEQLDTGTILAMTAAGHGWAFPAGVDADYMALTLDAIKADQ